MHRDYGLNHAEQRNIRFVPQLLWADEFEAQFAELMRGIDPVQARAYCAMSLAKVLSGWPWKRVAEQLELDGAHHSLVYRVRRQLAKDGCEACFHDQIEELLGALSRKTPLIDYAARRDQFRELTTVPDEHWEKICRRAGIPRTASGGRRRYCAAWLWAELTCGDPLRAPALTASPGTVKNVRCNWRRFVDQDLERLEPALRKVARKMEREMEKRLDAGRAHHPQSA